MKHIQLFGTAAPRIAMGCLLALGSAPALTAGLFVAQPGNMTRYELPGYTLVAVDNPQLRRDMTKLPRLKRALELSLGIDVRATSPDNVYIVSNSPDRYLAQHRHTERSSHALHQLHHCRQRWHRPRWAVTSTLIYISITRCPASIQRG
jgi:hypothetical protein